MQPVEKNAPAFKDHFSSVSTNYAAFRPSYPAELFEYLATLAPRSNLVWDCAAGNGQASIELARYFDKVIATDASSEQVRAAKAHPNVDYRVALAEESGLPGDSIGLLTVAQALHWFDLNRFYAEAKRVLRPGGVIAVWTYAINKIEGSKVQDIASNFYHSVVGPYWPPERQVVEQAYRTISFPFDELSAPSFQLETNWTLAQVLGYFGTWSATSSFIKANGRNPVDEVAMELRKVWGDADTPRHITWPLALRVGIHAG